MNNQNEVETEQLTNQDFVLRREKQRRRAKIRTGTDGVIGHQQVRDRCDDKRQKVKRKCRGERVKEERGARWLPWQQQPAFFSLSLSIPFAQTLTHVLPPPSSPLPPASLLWLRV